MARGVKLVVEVDGIDIPVAFKLREDGTYVLESEIVQQPLDDPLRVEAEELHQALAQIVTTLNSMDFHLSLISGVDIPTSDFSEEF